MTSEQIEHFLGPNPDSSHRSTKFFFKTRATFDGVFIKAPDYLELKKKNFWRVVTATKLEDYRQSKDISLSRIFNGSEFTRLTEAPAISSPSRQ
jgi:hypothetical protein